MLLINKKIGETPLECLNRIRMEQPDLKDETLSYAGRLDPMADGLLLVLVGDENKDRAKFLNFDKEYVIDVLFGFSTDSHDLLGLITNESSGQINSTQKEQIEQKIKALVGTFNQKYPKFSSKPVDGVPLFEKTKKDGLEYEYLPEKEVKITKTEVIGWHEKTGLELLTYIIASISLVKGDFRQKETLELWEKALKHRENDRFSVVTVKVNCSSGTYMRVLADEMAKNIGLASLAMKIRRTKIADFSI